MEIPFEIIISALVTPILGAVATLFWLLNKEKDKRLSDRDVAIASQEKRIVSLETTVEQYRNEVIPAQQGTMRSISKMADILEEELGLRVGGN